MSVSRDIERNPYGTEYFPPIGFAVICSMVGALVAGGPEGFVPAIIAWIVYAFICGVGIRAINRKEWKGLAAAALGAGTAFAVTLLWWSDQGGLGKISGGPITTVKLLIFFGGTSLTVFLAATFAAEIKNVGRFQIFPPSYEPQVFVSYAWGDETPAGRQQGEVVDCLCTALGQQGIKVHRDRDEMRPGDLISEFMDKLAEADFVLAVISDKYLRSEYCMYELFRIYRNCADKPDRFLMKVIPMILPDAHLDSAESRLDRANYWTTREEELKPQIAGNVSTVGTELFRKFKLTGEFARNTSNMLEHLVDKLQPRDFERQAADGFKEVLSQIKRGG